MSLKNQLLRALAALAVAHAALWAPSVAQAQNNSREAAEAVRKLSNGKVKGRSVKVRLLD